MRIDSLPRYNQIISRGVAQPGSASALGAEGREFESLRPDHSSLMIFKAIFPIVAAHLISATAALKSIL